MTALQGKQFYFVRHAETEWNEKNLCQGQRDIPLSDLGRKHAASLAQMLASFPIHTICSSPLVRALETAEAIRLYHPSSSLHLIDGLKERDWGALEGIPSKQMYAVEQSEEIDPHFHPGNGVEPRSQFQMRIVEGINQAFQFSPNPFLVSHGRVFLSLCDALGIPSIRQLPNLTVVEFSRTSKGWHYKSMLGSMNTPPRPFPRSVS